MRTFLVVTPEMEVVVFDGTLDELLDKFGKGHCSGHHRLEKDVIVKFSEDGRMFNIILNHPFSEDDGQHFDVRVKVNPYGKISFHRYSGEEEFQLGDEIHRRYFPDVVVKDGERKDMPLTGVVIVILAHLKHQRIGAFEYWQKICQNSGLAGLEKELFFA